MRTLIIAFVTLVLAIAQGFADQDPTDALRQRAVKAADAKDYVGAFDLFGEAFTLAHKKGDLAAESRVYRGLSGKMGGVSGSDLRRGLGALAAKLNPKRSGAFASAHLFAHRSLLEATAAGDTRFVRGASKVIRTHAARPKTGAFAAAMRDYADGMIALVDEDDAAAARSLEKALRAMSTQRWAVPAMHAGTELACVYVRLRQEASAATAMELVAHTLPEDADTSLSYVWRNLIKARLSDAPKSVLAPYEKAMAPHLKSRSIGMAGGAGGAGAPAGATEPLSELGAALPKWSSRKPLVTVKRTREGFALAHQFGSKYREHPTFRDGVRIIHRAGVTMAFWDRATGLVMVDLRGLAGAPGESSARSPLEPFYHLALGEVWNLNKKGEVTITRR